MKNLLSIFSIICSLIVTNTYAVEYSENTRYEPSYVVQDPAAHYAPMRAEPGYVMHEQNGHCMPCEPTYMPCQPRYVCQEPCYAAEPTCNSYMPNFGSCSGFYLGVFGGANFLEIPSQHHAKVDFKTGYIAGGSLGFRIAAPLRVEGEVTYRHNKLRHVKYLDQRLSVQLSTHTWSYMGNMIYDMNFVPYVTPYVGAGAGYAETHVNIKKAHASGKKGRFAWQVLAGIDSVLDCLGKNKLGLRYVFFKTHHVKADNHSVAITLTHAF